jgi:hypothetical protein
MMDIVSLLQRKNKEHYSMFPGAHSVSFLKS